MPNLSKIDYLGTEYNLCKTQLDSKANVDGLYESMTVGNAEQLVSTVFTEDSVPYLFRTSGGSIDIGDREYDEIVGGTVVWNQLVDASSLSELNIVGASNASVANNVITLTSNATTGTIVRFGKKGGIPSVVGHKVLLCGKIKASANGLLYLYNGTNWVNHSDVTANTELSFAVVFTIGSNGLVQDTPFGFSPRATLSDDTIIWTRPMVIDLTAFFGSSTIPDYIYSLEQATAGSGVAWLKKYFPKLFEYHEYDAGTLKSVEGVESHDMVGFNQWDEEWELGRYDTSTGAKVNANDRIRCKNPVPVFGNTEYCFVGANFVIYWYDSNDQFISYSTPDSGTTRTSPSNAKYLRFNCVSAYGTTYKNDICINLSWDGERNGEYEPYVRHSYPLDSTLTLRGIPKLDANNSLYYDGDTYEADGTVTRRYGIVDLGTLTWKKTTHESYGDYFFASISGVKYVGGFTSTIMNAICPKYPCVKRRTADFLDKTYTFDGNASQQTISQIQLKDSDYTDATAFKTAMSGVMLVYELATPTTESAEPYTNPQIVDDWGTEEYVTDCLIPVGHNTKYAPNLRAKLEMLPDSPNGDGDYIVRQSNGQNAYAPLVIPSELPNTPTTDGTYVLKCTVSGGQATLSWEVEE